MKAGPLSLRLFLEGVEVPIISAQVVIQPDRPAAAALQIVPLDSALNLLPRTLVHVFYLQSVPFDDYEEDTGITYAKQKFSYDVGDENYRLLFSGEVIGYNFAKTTNSRQLVLQCMDMSSYWDACYQWFADYSRHGTGLTDKSHTFVGAGSGLFDNISSGTQWVIGQLLQSKPRTPEYKNISGLLGGVIHLLEAVGGVRPRGSTFRGYSGANPFFTVAELRYNLLGMLGAVEKDKTSVQIYAAKAFQAWLRSGMTSLGNLMSFRDIINHVNRYIFHNIYPNPAAYFAPGGRNTTWSDSGSVYTDVADGQTAEGLLKSCLGKISQARGIVDLETTEGVGSTTLRAKLAAASTLVSTCLIDVRSARALIEGIQTDDRSRLIPQLFNVEAKIQTLDSTLPAAGKGGLGDLIVSDSALAEVEEDLRSLLNPNKRRPKIAKTAAEGAHLYSQLLLPEAFFVPPPRCNVLFPDQYYSFGYNRNFMREVTRLSCHSGLGLIAGRRGAKLLSRHYFAPSVRGTDGRTLAAAIGQGANILLPHEVHTGIVPKFEWVTQGHRWGVKAAKTGGQSDQFYQAGKVGYVQRLAHFQFYQHRWMARTMNVEAIFNPMMVVGFPALIIDRGAPPPDQLKELQTEDLPTQYLGKVVSLTHNASQSGGMTSISLSHCRTHRGVDDEFLNLLMKEKKKKVNYEVIVETEKLIQSTQAGGKKRRRYVDLLQKFMKGRLVPGTVVAGLGKVVNVEASPSKVNVSEFWIRELGLPEDIIGLTPAAGLDLLSRNPQSLPTSVLEDPTTDVTYTQGGVFIEPAGELVATTSETRNKSIIQVGAVPKKITVSFEKWKGTGEYQRSDLSIEDAIMPGWYSQVWKKSHITEDVYGPLIGSRAITSDASSGVALLDATIAAIPEDTVETGESVDFSSVRKRGTVEESEFLSDFGTDLAVYEVQTDTLEDAIDGLAIVYGLIQWNDQDVHRFIENYTYRPIATMPEILGSQNLQFGATGEVVDPTTMIEGFHSRAFGDYNVDMELGDDGAWKAGSNSLKNLVPGLPEGSQIDLEPIIVRGKKPVPVPPTLDPRGRARARAKAYADELAKRRGFRG